MYAGPMMPIQALPMRPQPLPQPVTAPMQPAPRPLIWQAAETLPIRARGVAPEPVKFVLPSPETLGIAAAPAAQPLAAIDWQAMQARMARLGVLRYRKDALPTGGCRVTLLLPGVRPVTGEGATEADAALAALLRAESRN